MIVDGSKKTKRRTLGQVRTPESIATWMTAWACAHRPRRVLEPAAGDGVFVKEIAEQCKVTRVTAFEVDREQIAALRRRMGRGHAGLRLACQRDDFITAADIQTYDAVVANPPYVRHHSFSYDESIWRRFDSQCGQRISRLTNLYGLFILRIWSSLDKQGRAAIITPAEWLNADFGKALKCYLLRENAIDALVHFRPESLVFRDALTTAVIMLLRRGRSAHELIRLVSVDDPGSLGDDTLTRGESIKTSKLDPDEKWTALFGPKARPNGSFCKLGRIATCSRGIATGANNYFTLRKSDCEQWSLNNSDFALCVTKAAQIKSDKLTPAEVRRWVESNQRVFLLNPKKISRNVKEYLEHGRAQGIDRRFLPSHRPVWFMPEQRPPAPILIGVFSRGTFRVVLNEPRVLNLTAYHGIYPHSKSRRDTLRLFKFLKSAPGQTMIARQRRIYGGGLYKLEPKDVEQIEIPLHCAN